MAANKLDWLGLRLGLMTLGERRNWADLIELFRISKGLSAISLESFFELDTSGRTRGHSLMLRRRRFPKDTRKFFFSQRVVNRWNALDEEVVTAGSVDVFKERLQKFCEKRIGCFKDQLWSLSLRVLAPFSVNRTHPGKHPGKHPTY